MGLMNFLSNFIITILLLNLFLNSGNVVSASCQGCVELDILTFDKLLAKFKYSLIKFDIAFPYGEKHEEFGKFAKNYVTRLNDELLIGLVGIKDYGDKDNSELGEKYSVDKEKYPAILIFKNTTVHARWPGHLDVNYKNVKQFIGDNTDLYIGLDGCLKEFDDIIENFMKSKHKTEKESILKSAKSRSELIKETSQIYVVVMEKILKIGNKFVSDEISRLEKLFNTKISSNKKKEIAQKLNIMKMFEKHITKKEEL